MLRITVNRSASGAKKYYSEKYYSEGQTKNYYSEKDEVIGIWQGKAAAKLGLTGNIDKSDFASLCDNQNPETNLKLTERNNIERRVGYDFTFNASKSVSLAYTFATEQDKKLILKAFRDSVSDAMSEIENDMQTRVRQKGQNDNRVTGNIAYGEFIHFTSRPVDGVPDPHLHAHCFVFNATFDQIEQKWKAGEFGQIKKDAQYYEAVFHSALASRLKELGYNIEKSKNGFEISGVSKELRERFSRRTEEIEHLAKEHNVIDIQEKAGLGAKTRESKRESVTETEQQSHWAGRLSEKEKLLFLKLKSENGGNADNKNPTVAKGALTYSIEHNLERRSVVTEKEVLTTALKVSMGQASPDQVKQVLAKDSSLISVKEKNQTFITNKTALFEENALIVKAQAMKGCFKPIHENYQPKTSILTDEQKKAVQCALTTSDGIVIIAGKAGTGKTTLMKEIQQGIKEANKEIFAFAPSAEASRGVQRSEGFEDAETLAVLIQNKNLQENIKNSIVWIDEAGMISNKHMNAVLDFAKKQNVRLILTGDIKQHGSVERGDALRILQKDAGINPIMISKIQRQKEQSYRDAVSNLAKGDIEKGFSKLDKRGAIHEVANDKDRIEKVAHDYVTSAHGQKANKPPKEVLVVSPTHAEGEKVTLRIREKLKAQNLLSQDERKFRVFKNVQLTNAEKQNVENYSTGNWLVFHQNIPGVKAGSKLEIVGTENKTSILARTDKGVVVPVSVNNAASYNVFEPREIGLCKGDKIRITGNGKCLDGKHLFNGSMYKVAGFDKQGNIKLSNGSSISSAFGHISHGYVMTSHSSQGKTVDKIIISQSSTSFKASSMEQFYVSVSRGRNDVAIYTNNKADLLKAVSQTNERKSARELTQQKALSNVIDINRARVFYRIREKALDVIQKVKPLTKAINKVYGVQRNITKETGRGR